MVNVNRKPWDQLSTKQKALLVVIPTISAVVAFILNCYSLSQAAVAYTELTSVANDVVSTIANFQSKPITQITIQAAACPTSEGWSSLSVGTRVSGGKSNEKDKIFTGEWPGASAMCNCATSDCATSACSSTNRNYNPAASVTTSGTTRTCNLGCNGRTTTQTTCTANQTSAYCSDIPAVSPVQLVKIPNIWGTQSATTRTGYNLCVKREGESWQSYVNSNLTCTSDQVLCGGFCFTGTQCPLESFTITQSSSGAPTVNPIRLTSSSSNTSVPLINIVVGQGMPCYGSNDNNGVSGLTQVIGATNNRYASPGSNVCGSDSNFPGSVKTDRRYFSIASIDQYSMFMANEIQNNGLESRVGTFGLSNPSYVYNNRNTNAGTSPTSDANIGAASLWGIYGRGGIYWKPSCAEDGEVKKDKVSSNADPVAQLVGLQGGLLAVQIIFGLLFAGMFIPIVTLMNIWRKDQDVPCIPGEGMVEKKRIGLVKGVGGLVSNLIKLIVMLLCVGVTGAIAGIFATLKDKQCSDEITNYSFELLSTTIDKVHTANTNGITSDIVSIVIILLGWLYAAYKKCAPDYSAMIDPPPEYKA